MGELGVTSGCFQEGEDTYMMHAKEHCACEGDTSVPREDGEGSENTIEEYKWDSKDG